LIAGVPDWVDKNADEVEELVIRYAKDGAHSGLIGVQLRDSYGIPSVKLITGKTISEIMKENDLSPRLPEDLLFLMRKAVNMHKHIDDHHGDTHNRRQMHLCEAKIRRLIRYYKQKKVLDLDFKYTPKTATLLVD